MEGTPSNTNPLTTVTEELRQRVERAERGDETALPGLRRWLDTTPALWKQYGDLAAAAQRAWVDRAAGDNLMLKESLTRQLDALKAELAGAAEPPPLEGLLIQRIAACWLQTHYADALYAQLRWEAVNPAYVRAVGHLQDRAHRRYLAAVKQLALVRKLIRPALSPVLVAARFDGVGGRVPASPRRGRRSPSKVGAANGSHRLHESSRSTNVCPGLPREGAQP
jgi:hypothetical protein